MTMARLSRIAASCPDPEGRRFLSDALRKMERGLPADLALDLCGVGAKRERDRLLCRAAALLDGTTTEKARAIAMMAERLAWAQPRTDVEHLVYEAKNAYRVPRWRQLFNILQSVGE